MKFKFSAGADLGGGPRAPHFFLYFKIVFESTYFRLVSVPNMRRVSGQWLDKEGYLTRQMKWKILINEKYTIYIKYMALINFFSVWVARVETTELRTPIVSFTVLGFYTFLEIFFVTKFARTVLVLSF